ncbi:RNA polymerase sigma factor SigJ [Paenibacillus tarimensis]|uniref:RNA polymerase sigma factor SigJ n=1 Tax=Paenibacillus tarimensis TaxID=416012 RepID=UPI001F3F1375|nr:RNA polymerase sigma factor SigJ [Paenibacillus tarimensis]MCF2943281.1 RNA polymerase sigma factor SigJ [Paenibacillus tarimensis]
MNELYIKYRRLLFTIAYQLTGSIEDAEDAVQEVFIKYSKLDGAAVGEPKAYLCKMVTNYCLDQLKSARRRREYIGPWLPDPLLTPDDDAISGVIRTDLLSYALLVLLERLSPAERAVFVLREALQYEYSEIAEITDRKEAGCRKLMSRAKAKMGYSDHEVITPKKADDNWVRGFLGALEKGKVEVVLGMLAKDATLVSDGGGKVSAAAHPVRTKERVSGFLFGLLRKNSSFGHVAYELAPMNQQTGVIVRSEGLIIAAVLLHRNEDVIHNIYFVRNPDKLKRLTLNNT